MSEAVLRARLERAEGKVRRLEQEIEDRTRELYMALRRARGSSRTLEQVATAVPAAVLVVSSDDRIMLANAAAESLFGEAGGPLVGRAVGHCFVDGDAPSYATLAGTVADGSTAVERMALGADGEQVPVLVSLAPISDPEGKADRFVCVALDIRTRRASELALRQAQKLEAVGRLAAGVAHEINTPVQFVSDSIHFLQDAVVDVTTLIGRYRELLLAVEKGTATPADASALRALEDEVDLEYLVENTPQAIRRAREGLSRVASIVRSLKEFSHPDAVEMSAIDLNAAIDSVLTIARNEYKYIAEVQTDLGQLPPVRCHGGEMNQVLLNLIVNAAHAIEERYTGTDARGLIRITSRAEDGFARISVSDDGTGIPEQVRMRIFDPFFTTKPVGKGTGQGLAFVRSMVVDRHRGEIGVETEPGRGTTFHVRIPVAGTTEEAIA